VTAPEDAVPKYEYACTACDHRFEAVQSFSDPNLTGCPVCEGKVRKLFSSVGIVFRGPGFYRTDSRAGAAAGDEAKERASKNGEKSDKSSDKGGEKSGSKSGGDAGSSGSTSSGSGSGSGSGSEGSKSKGSAPAAAS